MHKLLLICRSVCGVLIDRTVRLSANFVVHYFLPSTISIDMTFVVGPFLVSFQQVVGPRPLEIISRWMNSMTGNTIPVWNPYMPKGASRVKPPSNSSSNTAATTSAGGRAVPRKVVYLPSCVTRMMGPAAGDSQTASVHEKLMSLFDKAGYEVRPWLNGYMAPSFPEDSNGM